MQGGVRTMGVGVGGDMKVPWRRGWWAEHRGSSGPRETIGGARKSNPSVVGCCNPAQGGRHGVGAWVADWGHGSALVPGPGWPRLVSACDPS